MKKIKLFGLLIMFIGFFNQASAQSTSYVGNWESTGPVAAYNGQTLRLQIASTADPDVFIIVNEDTPKMKYTGKHDYPSGRLFMNYKKKMLYFIYVPATDMLEGYNAQNDVKIADFVRY